MACVYRAALLGSHGEFDASVRALDKAAALGERLPPAHTVPTAATLVRDLTLQHIAPDWAAMGERMYAAACRRDPGPWFGLLWAAIAAHAFARAGDDGRAREVLGQIMPAIVASDPWDYAQTGAVNFSAEAVWDLRAGELAEPLLASAQALIDAGAGDYYMAGSELTVARLRALLGRPSREDFERARQAVDARGQLVLRAIVDHDEDVARRLARVELPDGLTAREAEVLRLLAGGRTNKEIAGDLVLSVFTVERHLANAYRKISVRNRADATAYVLRAQL
jgi:DNA-binding CsgD family transcriptional regulator